MSRPKQAPLVLTERGEMVRDALCAVCAFLVLPATFWVLLKMAGL